MAKAGPKFTLKDTVPTSLAFHPSLDLLAVSTITGDVSCYEYTPESTKRQFVSRHHKDSVRSIAFGPDGRHLYSCSVDRSIQVLDMETRQVVNKKGKAHENPINVITPLNENLVATGDDMGRVRIWDMRSKSVVQQWHEHEDDVVNAFHWTAHKKTLVSVGNDGYLAVYDIRKPNVVARSDNLETELMCVAPVRGGSRLCVGMADGAISVWKWGWWGDMDDRFPGHPGEIDSMVALADDLVVTGCSDGLVRVLSVLPNKLLGVIGSHEDFPVENMAASHDRRWLATCSHDATVQFWSLGFLEGDGDSEDNEEEEEQETTTIEKDAAEDSDESWESVSDAEGDKAANDSDDDQEDEEEKEVEVFDPTSIFADSDDDEKQDLEGSENNDSDDSDDVEESSKTRKRKKTKRAQAKAFTEVKRVKMTAKPKSMRK
ncbi:WD40-repeat-containing domain protein [Blastocladiella britannica]|nr:WD40-repeat-containing domain protein [Blastocladiella britannica]